MTTKKTFSIASFFVIILLSNLLLFSYLRYQHEINLARIASFIPDEVFIEKTKDFAETKTLLKKYPDAYVYAERSDNLTVQYRYDKYKTTDVISPTAPYVRLVFPISISNLEVGAGIFFQCYNGKNILQIRKDKILSYLENEQCF